MLGLGVHDTWNYEVAERFYLDDACLWNVGCILPREGSLWETSRSEMMKAEHTKRPRTAAFCGHLEKRNKRYRRMIV